MPECARVGHVNKDEKKGEKMEQDSGEGDEAGA